jgi:REP-associated tyrosine transposase
MGLQIPKRKGVASMIRIKLAGRQAVFHCISRVVGAERLLDDAGKEKLTQMLWRQAAFCGVQIITFCMMSNHFHVLVRVPATVEVTDAELIERLEILYGRKGMLTVLAKQCVAERGRIDPDLRQRWVQRMGDVSVFMAELKHRFSIWYNRRHQRFGTLWAERFRSVLVEDRPSVVEAVAAYIDLNPVRAGMVEDPKDYRFCGYAAAVAGKEGAREGLMSMDGGKDWAEWAAGYRMRLFVRAGGAHQYGKVVLREELIKKVLAQKGQLSLAEVLRVRVRHLSDGVVLGTREFVNEVFELHRRKFGPKRNDGARPIRALASIGLMALRDLRVRTLG